MMNVRIQIILVLYGMPLQSSAAFGTWRQCMHTAKFKHHLLIYNNSHDIPCIAPNDCTVINATQNDGLSIPYNIALKQAQTHGASWLLTLDQDTSITEDYVQALNAFLSRADANRYAAALPQLRQDQLWHSPTAYRRWRGVAWRCRPVRPNNYEALRQTHIITAFNSGTLFNVQKVNELDGFSHNFPLDMLDHWTFYQIHLHHWPLFLTDARLEHCLSHTMGMTPERYNRYLAAHRQFASKLGFDTLMCFLLHLIYDAMQQKWQKKHQFYHITLHYLLHKQ